MMPLRRFITPGTMRRPSPGLHADNKQQRFGPFITKKRFDPLNAAAAAAAVTHPDQISFPQSIATDSSSSLGEEDNHGPVDLDVLEEMMVEEELIRYFEEVEEGEVEQVVEEGGGRMSKMGTGPVDLDMLEDDFDYYDDDEEEEEEKEEDATDRDVKTKQPVQENTSDNRSTNMSVKVSMSRVETEESRQDQMMKCQLFATINYDQNGSYLGTETNSIGERYGSSPVDMDDVYDLETTFDSILDEHEDNFMVWTANRKSVNAILIAEEKRTTRKEREQIYGQSFRRDRKQWSFA
jgi:hypothetical protein